MEEDESGYLFSDGRIIDFEKIILKNIDFSWKTGALRIRTTTNEVNVDFIAEIKPTREQLEKIKVLKTSNRRLIFEIADKENKIIGHRGFDKTFFEMEEELKHFYKESIHLDK